MKKSLLFILVGGVVANSNAITPDFSTYIGGAGTEYFYGIGITDNNEAIVGGNSNNLSYPTTSGAYDVTHNGQEDVVVTKFAEDGQSLIFSTFIGGSSGEEVYDLAIDPSGNSYIVGFPLSSSDFPFTSNAYETNGGANDGFLIKLSANGDSLIYATATSGSGTDSEAREVTADSNGNAYVTGRTFNQFPVTTNAFQTTKDAGYDCFVMKFSAIGDSVEYSSYLGGNDHDVPYSITVDSSGSAYVVGLTEANIFNTTPNAFQPTPPGNARHGFISKVSPTGDSLIYSTYLGGTTNQTTSISDIVLNSAGNAFVVGTTLNSGFPTTQNAYGQTYSGQRDIFVTKMSVNGDSLVYSTLIGDTGNDFGYSIGVDESNGEVVITGLSTNFPVTSNAIDSVYSGSNEAIISLFDSTLSNLIYSSYFGGSSLDRLEACEIKNDNLYFTGYTGSIDIPILNAYQNTIAGNYDGVLLRFSKPDLTPPAQISDFTLTYHNGTNVTLTWTATGDDNLEGQATSYEIRKSTSEITEANFANATFVSNIPTPSASGVIDTVVVDSLTSGVQYYFAKKVIDDAGNESPIATQTSFGRAWITSIVDVGNDNGKQVRVHFNASLNDINVSTGLNVNQYLVYRKVTTLFSPNGKNSNKVFESLPSGTWEQVGNVWATADQNYTIVVPTLADSNATGSNDFEFLIRAKAYGMPWITSISNTVSAHSIDNLAPTVPPNQNFVNNGNGTITASWTGVTDSDLANYKIWAETSQNNFSLVTTIIPTGASTQSETFNDVSGAISYTVGSIDFNGNEVLPTSNRISSLEIETIGNNLLLTWLEIPSATLYKVYRSTNPNFSNATQIGTFTPNGNSPTFTDVGSAQNTDKYFYFVTFED